MWQSISKNTKIILISSLLIVIILAITVLDKKRTLIGQEEAISLLDSKENLKVLVKTPYIYIDTEQEHYKVPELAIEKERLFQAKNKNYLVEYYEESTEFMDMILFSLLVFMMIYILFVIRSSRKTQEEYIGRQKEEMANPSLPEQHIQAQRSNVNFSDIAGVEGVKEELEEVIDFLRYPQKYKEFDIRLPKGVLLVGPPGVGKTLIAKAVAGEANVPFFYQSAASFVQIYVGMGAKRVSELFEKAKEMSPSIIFIDEIDAVGKSRGGYNNEERESTLNQLLTEMDGFEESSGVMVIAATNKIEVLDEALLRAGRFDRRVHIALPDLQERIATLELYLKNKVHTVDVPRIAKMTIGFNSASLATLINEAALFALRLEKQKIETSDVEAVKEKVLLGKHKIKTYNDDERKIQALYQAAKAVTASWFEVDYERIGILNSNFILHSNEILSKTFLENELKILLAGRVATEKVYGEFFSNAKEDINEAKILTHKIIEEFAMSKEYFGTQIEAQTLLNETHDEVKDLLAKLSLVVDAVSAYLLENESITPNQTKKIIDEIF